MLHQRRLGGSNRDNAKIETITGKSGDQLKAFLTTAIKIYELKSGKPTTNTDATLLRISAIFAGPLAIAIQNNSISISTTINPETIAPGFPKFMCLSTISALSPDVDVLKEGDQMVLFD